MGGQTRVDMQGSNTDFTYVKPILWLELILHMAAEINLTVKLTLAATELLSAKTQQ